MFNILTPKILTLTSLPNLKANPKVKNIAVAYGGISGERPVSLKSGLNVAQSLFNRGYNVMLLDIQSAFDWKISIFNPVEKKGNIISEIINFRDLKKYNIDLVFNALHGSFGEDGGIQNLLELINIPYTGTGILGSCLGMNKVKCSEILEQYGILTPTTYQINSIKELEYLNVPFPLFVKPNSGGSSIATGKANNIDELNTLVTQGLEADTIVLVQEYIESFDGKEYTCPVFGNGGQARAMPVGSIETKNSFFDFEAKYNSKDTIEVFPAIISKGIATEMQTIALNAHKILNCKGVTRSDFIIKIGRAHV